MEIFKKKSELGKVYLKRYAGPLKISKRINDIESKINKIYKNFYLSTTDTKKQKELEEFLKNEQDLKNKHKMFIKLMKIEFKRKINLKELYPMKSAKNKETKNIYFNIIVNKNKKNKNHPYLQPINGRDIDNICKYNSVTEPNKIAGRKKIRYNNNKLTNFILANKKLIKSYKSYKEFKDRNKNNASIIQFKNSLKNKYRDIFKNKNSSNINIHPSSLYKNRNKLENIKSRNINRKINLFISENRNYENILSPINIDVVHDHNFLSYDKIKDNNINDDDGDNYNLSLSEERNLFNKFKNYLSKSISLKSINSNSGSISNKKLMSHTNRNNSVKYSIESFRSKNKTYKDNLYINRRKNSIYEHNMKAYKLLSMLNKSFYSTLDLSNKIKKNIKFYKKKSNEQTKKSKKEVKNINKKYFREIETPNIKSSLRINKERSWSKSDDAKCLFNFKYNYAKKEKSPLTFVQEYNKLRNRRRKNNKITKNIGFRISPYKEINKKKFNSFFSLPFKKNKY